MKYLLMSLLSIVYYAEASGQTTTSRYGKIEVVITKEKRPKRIHAKVEIKSPFVGGDSSWVHFIEQSINQSIQFKNGARPGTYIVLAQFIIAKDSSLSEIRCLQDPGFGMGEKVMRALKKGSFKWAPAPAVGVKVGNYRH